MAWTFRTPWSSRNDTATADTGIEGISRLNSETEASPITSTEKKAFGEKDVDITAAAEDLPKFAATHQFDPNLPQDKINILHDATATGDVEAMKVAEAAFAEDSPYEEVKSSTRPIDGGEPANTVRAWILGMIFVTICSGLNMFLSMRFVWFTHQRWEFVDLRILLGARQFRSRQLWYYCESEPHVFHYFKS